MMKKNEELPDIEKLGRHEFDLDVDEQARLQAEGDAEVERVREEIEFDNLAKRYLREMIKRECWDKMAVKGRAIVVRLGSLFHAAACQRIIDKRRKNNHDTIY
jgi:hypothetical protein